MLNMIQHLAYRLRHNQEGQTFVEYALVIGTVSIGLVGVFVGLEVALGGVVDKITAALGLAAEE